MKDRTRLRVQPRGDAIRGIALADDEQCIRSRELRIQWRAQGAGREHAGIADPAPCIDDGQREILGQRRILQAIVENDHACALRARKFGTGDTIACDDCRRRARKQQSFVANLRGTVGAAIHQFRSRLGAAITAAEAKRAPAAVGEHLCEHDDGGRLAGAAEREVAHAQHR